jgi:predicted HicB family RNase H-like nuclease
VKYKGYTAVLKLDEEQGILCGQVIGLRDVITFQAESVPQAIEEFHTSVDSYLELCRSRQESPEKPYSGNFMVRVDPELHRQIATWAQVESVSINSLVASLIRHACERKVRTANVKQPVRLEDIMVLGEEMEAKDIMASRDEKLKRLKELVASEQLQPPKKIKAKVVRHKPKPSTR